MKRALHIVSRISHMAVIAGLLVACGALAQPEGVQVGMSPPQVQAELGGPDEASEFTMPEEGVFGPQEVLSGIVSAGETVQQWVYFHGDEATYVWFSVDPEQGQGAWRVIATTTVPQDAVY